MRRTYSRRPDQFMKRALGSFAILLAVLCVPAAAQQKPAPTKVPVSYGLVVDNSGSFRTLLDRVISVVSEVIEENQPEDEAFLVTFVDTPKIVLRQEFTNRKSELHDAAQNMFIEGGQTALIDAVQSSATYLAENARSDGDRRKALVVVTDGEDRDSRTSIEAVIKLLKERNIRVYVIALAEGKVSGKILERLTKESGGAMVSPKKIAELRQAAGTISAAMRSN